MKSPEWCRPRNSYTSIILGCGNSIKVGQLIWNKDPISLTLISNCCLGFGTVVGPFWTSSSCYLRDSRLGVSGLESYFVLTLISNLHRVNDGFLYLRYILNSLPFIILFAIHHHHHHHHIVLAARISLTLSRHSSLSFIALGRSSGQQLFAIYNILCHL